VLLNGLFELHASLPAEVTAIALSSVVPTLVPVIDAVSQQQFGLRPLVVGPGVRTGMDIRYESPASLGTDRLVDAVAARAAYGAPVVVVDFGTATTFNVVNQSGAFAGGAIAPGIGIAAAALAQAGARLRQIDLAPPDGMPVVGRNTEHSMRSGVIYGYAGLVTGLLRRILDELAPVHSDQVPVVATGGMVQAMAPLVPRINTIAPDLTLDGLRLIATLNRQVA